MNDKYCRPWSDTACHEWRMIRAYNFIIADEYLQQTFDLLSVQFQPQIL